MKNEKVNSTLVSNYVQHIIDSFLISMAKRYDVKGKTYFKYPNKYYYTDIGLRNARLNYRQYDPGHIMENIVYNELLRRGYSVDVGVVTDRTGGANTQKGIDFVVNDADKKIYIQSAFQMDADKKESSELASLYPFLSLRSGTKRYENGCLSLLFLYNSSCRELGILQITGR